MSITKYIVRAMLNSQTHHVSNWEIEWIAHYWDFLYFSCMKHGVQLKYGVDMNGFQSNCYESLKMVDNWHFHSYYITLYL